MPRPISFANTPPVLTLLAFGILWALWCVFSVNSLVAVVQRHLVISNILAAWLLCMMPVLATAGFSWLWLTKDDQ